MKREELFAALNNIRDRYIEEADPYGGRRAAPVRKRSQSLRLLGMAAMLAVVLGVAALTLQLGRMGSNKTEDAVTADTAAAETVQNTAADEAESGEAAPEESAPEAPETAAPSEEGAAAEDNMKSDAQEMLDSEPGAGEAPVRPDTILWNDVPYERTGEVLTEPPAGYYDAGELSDLEETEFYANDPASSGYSVYRAEDSEERLYLAVPEGFVEDLRKP